MTTTFAAGRRRYWRRLTAEPTHIVDVQPVHLRPRVPATASYRPTLATGMFPACKRTS